MSVYENLMGQIADKGLLFNVGSQKLRTEDGTAIIGKRALINQKSGKVMSIVSDNYKVVTNEEIFSAFCKNVEQAKINVEGATINVRQTSTGSRSMVDFVFPSHSIAVRGDDSETALQFCALNSFDGSTRYLTKAGGLRMKCLNGQIVGDIIGSYSSLHTKSLDVNVGAEIVCKMVQDFQTSKEYWARMMQTKITDGTAKSAIVKFLNIKAADVDCDPTRENKRYARVLSLWQQYSNELGGNVYALYNAFTHFISHQEKQYKEPAKTAMLHRKKLMKTLNTAPMFKSLAQAA